MGRKMKADRVQQGSETGGVPQGWALVDDGQAMRRAYRQSNARAAVAMVAWVAALARACECTPTIEVCGDEVVVTVGRGDVELARWMEHG